MQLMATMRLNSRYVPGRKAEGNENKYATGLQGVRSFPGVSGQISFSEQRRTNVDLTLLKLMEIDSVLSKAWTYPILLRMKKDLLFGLPQEPIDSGTVGDRSACQDIASP